MEPRLRNKIISVHKVANLLGVLFMLIHSIWKVWTHIGLLWNSYAICCMKSRRRFMSPYARTINRGLKNTQNTFHW